MEDIEENDELNYPRKIEYVYEFEITKGKTGERIDVFLTRSLPNASRTKVQNAIDSGCVTVNDQTSKASRRLNAGDKVRCVLMKPPPIELRPEDLPLNIVYEDETLVVVNKAAGMCTHPGFGNRYGTLVNGLLYHFGLREAVKLELDDEEDEEINEGEIFASDQVRPGIVHRLDKDTSGLLVVAKEPVAHAALAKQFAERSTEREYNSVVWGVVKADSGVIEGAIGRSPRDRKLFAILPKGGKPAKTDYSILERFQYASLAKLKLHTGRTHQIRVHMSKIGHPVFGDTLYGGDKPQKEGANPFHKKHALKALEMTPRQMLHARTLGFTHPVTRRFMRFDSELPEDMTILIDYLRGASPFRHEEFEHELASQLRPNRKK
ncbi:MAG: RluA family pseudouridine synthase [Chloroflexota bacterium]